MDAGKYNHKNEKENANTNQCNPQNFFLFAIL